MTLRQPVGLPGTVAMPETMEKTMNTPEHHEDLQLVAHHFEWARIRLNLHIIEVARQADCDDIDNGCTQLREIENATPQPAEVYARFAPVLNIDLDGLEEQLQQRRDRRLEQHRQDIPARRLGAVLESVRTNADMSVDQVVDGTDGLVGTRRYHRLEKGRDRLPSGAELQALAKSFDIDVDALRWAAAQQRRVYDRLTDTPTFVARAVPGFYVTSPLPQPASTKQHLDYATTFARQKCVQVCLVFADSRSVYIKPDGTRRERFEPPSTTVQ